LAKNGICGENMATAMNYLLLIKKNPIPSAIKYFFTYLSLQLFFFIDKISIFI